MATSTQTLAMILQLKDEVSSGAKAAAGSLSATSEASQKAQAQLDALASRYALAGKQADILAKELDQLNKKYPEGGVAVEKKQLAIERLNASMGQIPAKAQAVVAGFEREAQAATAAAQALDQNAAASARAASGMDMASQGAAGAAGGLGDLEAGLQKLAGAYALVETAQTVVDFAQQGAAAKGVSDSFENLSASLNTTGDIFLGKLKTASNGFITDLELMKGANKAVLLGGQEMAQALPALLQIAGASAKATGEDITFIYDSLITGLARGSVEILDNAGLTINLEQVYASYADTVGKTVDQLDAAEKKQALLNEVLLQGDGFVQKIGTSANATGSSYQRLAVEFENAKVKLQELTAIGLEDVLQGGATVQAEVNRLAIEGAASYTEYTAAVNAANDAGGWQATVADGLLDIFDPLNILTGDLGENMTALSEAQYGAAQALEAQGMAASEAAAAVGELGDMEEALAEVLAASAEASGLSSEAQAELVETALTLAGANADLVPEIEAMIDAHAQGLISAEELQSGMAALEEQHYLSAAAAAQVEYQNYLLADATAAATEASDMAAASLYGLTDAQITQIGAGIEQQYQHEMVRLATAEVEAAAYAAGDGAFAEAAAVQHLANTLGIATTESQRLIDAQQALNAVLAGKNLGADASRGAVGIARAHERQVQQAQRQAQQVTQRAVSAGRRAVTAPARGGGGGARRTAGGGGGGGSSRAPAKTEAQRAEEKAEKDALKAAEKAQKDREKLLEKEHQQLMKAQEKLAKTRATFLEKMDELEKSHTEKVTAIWDEFYEKQKEATDKFNSDKFDTELSFRDSLKNMDAATRDAMRAQERAAWDESQAIAQAGNAEMADAYYEMRLEQIKADQERAEAIKEIEQGITEATDEETKARLQAELEYQQQLDADYDQRAADRLEALKNSGNELEIERDEQLAEENEDFSEARSELVKDFEESVGEIITSQDAAVQAQLSYEAAVVGSYGVIADAAASAASAIANMTVSVPNFDTGGGGGEAGGGEGPAPEGSYALGTGDKGLPRDAVIAAHAGEIIADPTTSDRIRAAGGLDALLSAATRPMPQMSASASTGSSYASSSSSWSLNIEKGAIVLNNGQATPEGIVAALDQLIDRKMNAAARAGQTRARTR